MGSERKRSNEPAASRRPEAAAARAPSPAIRPAAHGNQAVLRALRAETPVQRSCGCKGSGGDCSCDDEPVQRSGPERPPTRAGEVPEIESSSGFPLPPALHERASAYFGADLGEVRVHTDAPAAQASARIRAHAFTAGSDVYFGQGAYRPSTAAGLKLLGHELTHVVQQREGISIQSHSDERHFEHEADAAASGFAGGGGAAPARAAASAAASSDAVQKTSYDECTTEQQPSVEAAVAAADTSLGLAISMLNARPLTGHVRNSLWLAFRSDSETTADSVVGTLTKIKDGLPSATVECEQTDSWFYKQFCSSAVAYVRPGPALLGTGSLHLCMGSWDSYGPDFQSGTIIHEGAHRYDMADDEGYYGYGCGESDTTASLSVDDRLGMADAYNCVVEHLQNPRPASVAYAVNYIKNPSLSIIPSAPGPVSLSAEMHEPTFSIDGVPDNSGYRYRWVIADDIDRRYMMWSDAGSVFDFGEARTAFIPRGTRELIQKRGLTTAEMLCRVRWPGAEDQLLRRSITFA